MTFGVYIGFDGLLMVILLCVLFMKCHLRGRRWHCHLASASLCESVEQWAFDEDRRKSYIGMKAHA